MPFHFKKLTIFSLLWKSTYFFKVLIESNYLFITKHLSTCIFKQFLKCVSNVVNNIALPNCSLSCYHPIVFMFIPCYPKITLTIVPFHVVAKRQAKDTENQRSFPKFLQSTVSLKRSSYWNCQVIVSLWTKRTRP